MIEYWQKQTSKSPLYPDVLWSRPESKTGAGKLAIVGGNAFGFSAPGIAYNESLASGVGITKVVMPQAVQKTVKLVLPDADFAPSNRSGSFSKQALAQMIEVAYWSDGTILAGDFGRNSETAVLLETFVEKYDGLLTLTQDAVDYFKETPKLIVDRQQTFIALSLAQLQRLFIATPHITPITYSMSIQQLVDALRGYTEIHPATIATKLNDIIFVASGGNVVSQKYEEKTWRVIVATRGSVFWLQNPGTPLKAIVSSLYKEDLADA